MRSSIACLALTAAIHSTAGASLPVSGIVDAVTNQTLVEKVLKSSYSHVVVGGGTAGLVVAARLSEVPRNRVLVLEAGTLQDTNPDITVPAKAGSAEGTALDWSYITVPQVNLSGARISWPRGKLLGGSSCFNIEVWNRAYAADYDAWRTLGNPGWDWKSLLPYHEKSERFYKPGGTEFNANASYDFRVHGKSGPVQTSYNVYVSPQFDSLYHGLRSLNVSEMADPNGGDNVGVGWITSSVDPKTQTRSSSQTAYLTPSLGRRNLVVITSALASKVNFASKKVKGNLVATSVSFLGGVNSTASYTVKATSEVILSGGSINSPQLLELSGIGNKKVLEPLGIKTLINLPGVGENLQDHPTSAMVFKLKDNLGLVSMDDMSNSTFAAAAEAAYANNRTGILTQAAPILSYLTPSVFMSAADVETGRSLVATTSKDLPASQQQVILDTYDTSPMIEVVPLNYNLGATAEAGAIYFGIIPALQHALSRGSQHINSTHPRAYPSIDPKYFSHPSDAFHLAQGAAYVRKLSQTPALAAIIDSEARPGLDVVPANATTADWELWASQHIGTEYHPIGTTSMLPKADGGVVSPELIVYGTKNLRVIDAGIMPLHIATHIQTTAYAIGEKGAALILGSK